MAKGYVLVEGHGEVGAVGNLLARLTPDLRISLTWAPPIRWKNLHLASGVEKGASYIRAKGDANALLILRDEDDQCPAERGPEISAWLRSLDLPFPAAAVLFHPEFEVLFLPCLERMAGTTLGSGATERPGLREGTRWEGPWDGKRGVKEWLSRHYPPNRSYKPTLDQLPLTRLLDFSLLRAADLACYGTLERALLHLGKSAAGSTYPNT